MGRPVNAVSASYMLKVATNVSLCMALCVATWRSHPYNLEALRQDREKIQPVQPTC